MTGTAAHIRRETRLSIAINAALSMVFYLMIFGTSGPVDIWEVGGFAFDFVPQSFAITLMSVLVPGALTLRKLAAGEIAPLPEQSRLPRPLLLRALVLALAAALAGGVMAAAILKMIGIVALQWNIGAAIKICYGALLASIATPLGLRATLRRTTSVPQ